MALGGRPPGGKPPFSFPRRTVPVGEVFPPSTPRLIVSSPFLHFGQTSPSRTSCASTRSPSKSRPATTLRRCVSFFFPPAIYARFARELHLARAEDLPDLGLVHVAVAREDHGDDLPRCVAQ